MADSTSCVKEQSSFVADVYLNTEVIVVGQVFNDLLSEVVNIDDDTLDICGLQALKDVVKQRLSGYGDKGFGHRVGERSKASTKTCGEKHGLFHGCKRQIYYKT